MFQNRDDLKMLQSLTSTLVIVHMAKIFSCYSAIANLWKFFAACAGTEFHTVDFQIIYY